MTRRKSLKEYDDALESVMSYLSANVTTSKLKKPEDLRALLERLDKGRKDQQERRKFSDEFIDIMVERARHSRRPLARTFFAEGNIGTAKPEPVLNPDWVARRQRRIDALRSQGRTIIRYDGGLAYKSVEGPKRNRVVVIRDIDTKKPVAPSRVTDEE